MSSEGVDDRFFHVPCEFQIRLRVMTEEEHNDFSAYALRPSPYSTMKSEVENQLSKLSMKDDQKALFEIAFQLLINIDQRLERIEEQVDPHAEKILETYEWVHGDLGADGASFIWTKADLKIGQTILMDVILPALPEYRMVASARVDAIEEPAQKVVARFRAIHHDDKEFIHKFVIYRQREILRAKAHARDQNP